VAGATRVVNLASIVGSGGAASFGVQMYSGGTLINGGAGDRYAVISAYSGLELNDATGVNSGTIESTGAFGGVGVLLNGSATRFTNEAGASVTGYQGVEDFAGGALINFGTIRGANGTAVAFSSSAADLIVEPGSTFIGSVVGGGGVLDLGAGVGTLSGVLATGTVTVSGSMATTTFQAFNTVRIDAGASFTLNGGATLPAGKSLVVLGTATTAGTVTMNGGAFTLSGTLGGTGALALSAGTATFTGAASDAFKTTESGTATANFTGASITLASLWTQTAGTISVASGDKASFTAVGDSFSGTLGGAGTVAFTGGTDLLSKTSLKAANVTIAGATVTLSGAITNASAVTVTSPVLTIATAGASLSGGGSINLTNLASNAIKGATSAAVLTNVNNKITGAGTISGLVLVNQAGGVINGNQALALTINTGASAVTNAGLIENVGAGGTTITGAVANTGTLLVSNGVLDVQGAVSGTGVVKILGGTAQFGSTFTENVSFGTKGVLELAKSTTYTGQVSGFSKTGTTSFDLLDIAFASGTTKATYSGTTASGVLTVTDGTHTAKITLVGNYTASTWTVASDGHGGTSIHDPTAPLTQALAGFGAPSSAPERFESTAAATRLSLVTARAA
jgi:hypothetical protein